MKCISTLFTVLTIIYLGQAHQFPDFGSGPLHEDVQDFLDLIPTEEISKIVSDYASNDLEVKAVIDYLQTSTVLKNVTVDLEAIPEVIKLMNYVQKEGLDIYYIINKINRALGIPDLVPPSFYSYSVITQRTGGLAGLFEDITKVISFGKFIRTYVQKMRTSLNFVDFINQLKSDNFQQVVNKAYQSKSFLIIVNGLKSSGVNTQIVADVMYIVLDITVPNGVSVYQERTLKELLD
ncbi:protein G12 [Monomorium pharaonis]|uniref:protein G12 n=1 Tax=Monomorium pharaonis TaxID=307658 RepID=UPI00063F1F08|nr:protein G12 [Monomorium pharaonis]